MAQLKYADHFGDVMTLLGIKQLNMEITRKGEIKEHSPPKDEIYAEGNVVKLHENKYKILLMD